MHHYVLETTQLETSSAEKALGVLVNKLRSVARSKGGDRSPLFSFDKARVECCVRFWALPLYKRGMDALEKLQERAMNIYKESDIGKAERAGTFELGEEKAQGDLISVHKYLKGRCREDGARLLSVVSSDREAAKSPSLEIIKSSLDLILVSLLKGYLSEDQLKALRAYRQLMNDKKQTQMQEEFKKALESAEQEENGCSKRDVSAVWKLCVVDYRKQEKYKGVILSIWRPLLDICSLLKEGSRYRIYQLSASQSKGRADSTNIQLTATKKTQYLQLSVSQEMLVQIFFPRKTLKFTSLLDPSFQPPCAEVDLVGAVVSVSRTGFTTVVYLSDESCNFVAVKIWTDLRHLAIEDIVVRCSLISASNLQWQSEFKSEIPVLLAGDLSVFSASPKENYLQEKLNELRSMIENVASFCSDAESKLMNLLQRNLLLTPSLTKRSGLENPSPCRNFAEDKSLISSRIEMKHPSPLSTITSYMKLVTPGSAKTPSPAAVSEDHLKNAKKRKAMDFLSCIPAPPPLTPIRSVVSPSVKKAFQPPRSLGLQRSKSSKETDHNIGDATPCRKLRETVHLPENDLVADEELAMINTQALMNNLPEEKKMNYVNENSNTIATNLSGDRSSRNSSRSTEKANNSSKSSSEVAETLQKDPKEPQDSLAARRVLQRQKSRKCY
ncbi:hypothetical protein BTVI_142144 [Pitangus sulphuratus]|nr:hypothetical protein BTVI_142144 [Pitangus sulphuratus]